MNSISIPNPNINSTRWYRVIIDDPQLISSSSFRSLLNRILKLVSLSTVQIMHLEVIQNSASKNILPKNMEQLPINILFSMLDSITQFVWGRFFFFSESKNRTLLVDERASANNIAQCDLTICVADNTSYVIFTTSLSVVSELLADNWHVEVIKDDLDVILKRKEEF